MFYSHFINAFSHTPSDTEQGRQTDRHGSEPTYTQGPPRRLDGRFVGPTQGIPLDPPPPPPWILGEAAAPCAVNEQIKLFHLNLTSQLTYTRRVVLSRSLSFSPSHLRLSNTHYQPDEQEEGLFRFGEHN